MQGVLQMMEGQRSGVWRMLHTPCLQETADAGLPPQVGQVLPFVQFVLASKTGEALGVNASLAGASRLMGVDPGVVVALRTLTTEALVPHSLIQALGFDPGLFIAMTNVLYSPPRGLQASPHPSSAPWPLPTPPLPLGLSPLLLYPEASPQPSPTPRPAPTPPLSLGLSPPLLYP